MLNLVRKFHFYIPQKILGLESLMSPHKNSKVDFVKKQNACKYLYAYIFIHLLCYTVWKASTPSTWIIYCHFLILSWSHRIQTQTLVLLKNCFLFFWYMFVRKLKLLFYVRKFCALDHNILNYILLFLFTISYFIVSRIFQLIVPKDTVI